MQAMRLASENGIDVVLGDRDIEITLGRLNGNDNGSKTAAMDADNSSIINEVSTCTCCDGAATAILCIVAFNSSVILAMSSSTSAKRLALNLLLKALLEFLSLYLPCLLLLPSLLLLCTSCLLQAQSEGAGSLSSRISKGKLVTSNHYRTRVLTQALV
jgi:hypothetical protein